jgi:hypothetical protein
MTLEYLDKLVKEQTRKTWGALGFTGLLVGIGVGLPIWFFNRVMSIPDPSWDKTLPLSAVAITFIGFVWHGVRTLWTLQLAGGMRTGQLEDLKLAAALADLKEPKITLEDAAKIIMSLRRDQVAEKHKIEGPSVLGAELLSKLSELVRKEGKS